jgi:hypothetical protein
LRIADRRSKIYEDNFESQQLHSFRVQGRCETDKGHLSASPFSALRPLHIRVRHREKKNEIGRTAYDTAD